MSRSLVPVLTPHGVLRLDPLDDEFPLEQPVADRLQGRFARDSGHGLLHLGAGEAGSNLPPALSWWRDFAIRFVAALCVRDEVTQVGRRLHFPAPSPDDLTTLIDTAPPMRGGEYLRAEVLDALWREMERALDVVSR